MKKKKYTDQELKYLKKEFPEEYKKYTEQTTEARQRKKICIIAIPIITLSILLIAGALFGNPAIRNISDIILQLIGWVLLIGFIIFLTKDSFF